ncbi:MAG TPA: IclR family transcriptional regulator [Sphingobium sp.]|nr:IclR family transcriptional regulator [Sphingobium sp.]
MKHSPLSTGTAAIERALTLMFAIIEDGGQRSLAEHAEIMGLPYSTANRMAGLLERMGLLVRVGRGRYLAGLAFPGRVAPEQRNKVVAAAARPLLRKLARETKLTTHLGVWADEASMVHYIVKESIGPRSMFTQEDSQLEAYCSAIGKVLLAHLPVERLAAYLSGGGFVALTANTITDPGRLAELLKEVAADGYGFDRREIDERLCCVAVPVRFRGEVIAAISVSRIGAAENFTEPPAGLLACARSLEQRLSGKMAIVSESPTS